MSKKEFRKLCELSIHYEFCYCYLCGKPILKDQEWNLDHICPASKGGESKPYNLRPTHIACNSAKKDLTLAEFRAIQNTKER